MPLPLQHSLLRLEPPPPADAELCRSCVPSIMQGIWCLGQELASWLDRGPNPGNLVCAMNLSCNKHERVHARTLPLTPPPCVDLSRPWLDWGMSFLTRYDGELREPLVWCQESQVSMRVMRSEERRVGKEC